MRDKFRMRHSGEGDNIAGDHGGSDAARKQGRGDILSSAAAAEHVNAEEIQPLDRSPQHGVMIRGRRESGNAAAATADVKTTSPSHIKVDDILETRNGSPEKKSFVETHVRSPIQATSDSDVVNVSVTSRPREAKPTSSAGRRPGGHVSDSASRQDRRPHGAHRSGYVSDTSFSAVVRNAANDSLLSTATEGNIILFLFIFV